jgi:hypothetical protein
MPAASQPAAASHSEIAQLLKEHGAIEDVQRPLRIGISRKEPAYKAAVFHKGPDDSNRFTLFEVIAMRISTNATELVSRGRLRSGATPSTLVGYLFLILPV